MNNVKIYCYHKLDAIDIIDSREWARENFAYYDGETSPLWNEHVQEEFARLNIERDKWRDSWNRTFEAIAEDLKLTGYLEGN